MTIEYRPNQQGRAFDTDRRRHPHRHCRRRVGGRRTPAASETELAERFGVSRPTVREALKRLAAQNLIRTQRAARPVVPSSTGSAGRKRMMRW